MNSIKECDIQKSCVSWFRETYPNYILFSVSNEGCFKRKPYFESLGMLSGVSDTVVILPNKVLFIEFKALKKYQRPEQKTFQTKIENLNQKYYICRSLEEFKGIINNELN